MNDKPWVVTVDGPAGAGKSTLARLLAAKLGYLYLDTGAMYRAVAWAALQRGIGPEDDEAVAKLLHDLEVSLVPGKDGRCRVQVDGKDVTAQLRSPEVTRTVPLFAQIPAVREALMGWQRSWGERGGVVVDGRDMGTHVFPWAQRKFFVTASPQERARRRFRQLRRQGFAVTFDQVLREVLERDHQDETRALAPLEAASDAIWVDTTGVKVQETIRRMWSYFPRHVPRGAVGGRRP
ncbi:MAG: (d)CMP kinase [Bacillota bacterium]|nr:(d)CMP kinase [Bacillota bacterium]